MFNSYVAVYQRVSMKKMVVFYSHVQCPKGQHLYLFWATPGLCMWVRAMETYDRVAKVEQTLLGPLEGHEVEIPWLVMKWGLNTWGKLGILWDCELIILIRLGP